MAGDGAVDIDLYAQVDEFEPDVTGQVIFWSLYDKERICFAAVRILKLDLFVAVARNCCVVAFI